MDDSEDRRLIEAWQDVDGATSTDDCPPAERIWEAARGRLTVEERLAVIDHVTQCPACVEAWRLARNIEGDLPRWAASPVAPVWQMWPGAVAAAAVVVLALGLFLVPAVPPIDRDPPAARLEIATPEDAVLSRDAFVLRWRPGAAGQPLPRGRHDRRTSMQSWTSKPSRGPSTGFCRRSCRDCRKARASAGA